MHQINLMNRVYLSSGIFERKNNLIIIEQIYRGSSELEDFFFFVLKNGRAVRSNKENVRELTEMLFQNIFET